MRFIVKPAARLEFFEAVAWYENQRAGLGRDFAREVRQALKRARLHPELFPETRSRARKIRLKRFRHYAIYFAIKADVFCVLAIFHASRDPKELERRLE